MNGKHRNGYQYRNKRNNSSSSKNSIIGTILSAISGIVIKDLSSQNSRIKSLVSKIIKPKEIEKKPNKIIEADYEILESQNKSNKILKGKK